MRRSIYKDPTDGKHLIVRRAKINIQKHHKHPQYKNVRIVPLLSQVVISNLSYTKSDAFFNCELIIT